MNRKDIQVGQHYAVGSGRENEYRQADRYVITSIQPAFVQEQDSYPRRVKRSGIQGYMVNTRSGQPIDSPPVNEWLDAVKIWRPWAEHLDVLRARKQREQAENEAKAAAAAELQRKVGVLTDLLPADYERFTKRFSCDGYVSISIDTALEVISAAIKKAQS